MDIDIFQPLALGELQKAVNMRVVAVHAARGDQPHQVERRAVLPAVLRRLEESLILEEIPVLDRFRDPGQLLVDYSPRAHVHMADFRVAHLAVRKADRKTAGIAPDEGIFLLQAVHIRGLCLPDRVVLVVVGDPVAIKNQ